MPKLQLATTVFSRPSYGLPELGALNVLAEETPFGIIILPRPPLTSRATVGTGPIRGVFRQKGTFAGSTLAVSGTELYRGTSLIGTIPGSGPVRLAGSDIQLVIVVPELDKAYVYQQSGLAELSDPDLPGVHDVFVLASRFFYQRADDDEWWFSALDDATDIEGLAFATAESKPDATVASATLGNEAVFFGQETIEFWPAAGDANAPLVFSRRFDKGCLAQGSVLTGGKVLDHRLFFVGDDRMVYVTAGGVPERISTSTIEERLRLCGDDIDDCAAFPASIDGHTFYGLNIPGQGTFVYGIQGGGWVEWSSYGRTVFRVRCGVMSDGEAYLGDDTDGTVWKFGTAQQLDGSARITQKVSAFIDHSGPPMRVPPITMQAVMGQGAHTDPEAEMRLSRNRGRTWEGWDPRSLGQQGEYDLKAIWRRKGMIDSRGLLIEIRHSENIVSAAFGLELEARP